MTHRLLWALGLGLVTLAVAGPAPAAWSAPAPTPAAPPAPANFGGGWLTSVAALRAAKAGSVTVLDARGNTAYAAGHVPGAVAVNWMDYRDGWFLTGRLAGDLNKLSQQLSALGVDSSRPVVVYGAAQAGWGEEGRIVWMLRYLGHPRASVLDGAWKGWLAAGGPRTTTRAAALPGRFVAHAHPELRASESEVASAPRRGAIVLDTRTDAEWHGATPYLEARGGHVPRAIHLPWTEFLTPAGAFDRGDRLRAALKRRGITANKPIITYCTGGVRSALSLVALKALGYRDVRNYDGSFWEWARDRKQPVVKD